MISNVRKANSNEANWNVSQNHFDPSYKNVTLPSSPGLTNLNKNLAIRSGYNNKSTNIKPDSYVRINTSSRTPFYSNMWLNNAHTKKVRLSGLKPENILDRYNYEQRLLTELRIKDIYDTTQAKLAAAEAEAKLRQQENIYKSLQNTYRKNAEKARNAEKRAINAIKTLNLKRKEAKKTMYSTQPKKSFFSFIGGSGKNTRKNRKNNKSRSRKQRRN